MSTGELKNLINEDYKVYAKDKTSRLKTWILCPGFNLVTYFRLCQFLCDKSVLFPLYVVVRMVYRHLCIKYSIDIPSHSHIGGGLYIPHAIAGGIVINGDAIIGKNVTLLSNVVIGGNHTGVPIVGDNCFFGANSVTIGNIKIGDNAVIGAGATVTHDVDKNAVVIGPSARMKGCER